jgi:hypothetical protein
VTLGGQTGAGQGLSELLARSSHCSSDTIGGVCIAIGPFGIFALFAPSHLFLLCYFRILCFVIASLL